MKKNKGLLIVFEGIDGSGKGTLIKKLNDYLINKGYETLLTREPGNAGYFKDLFRKLILDPESKINNNSELLLYFIDRSEHIDKVLKPALKEGKIVLCDRYFYSTLAYQGYGRGFDLNLINNLISFTADSLFGDLVFLLDIKPEFSLKRSLKDEFKKEDRLEREGVNFLNKVRKGYLLMANNYDNFL